MIAYLRHLDFARHFWGAGFVPQDTVMVGAIIRSPGISGALFRRPDGTYQQGNAGTMRPVNQETIKRALRCEGAFIAER